MVTLSDQDLTLRIMTGDLSALASLVERYHGPLLGYLYRLVNGNRQLAEDLVQETFLRVLIQDSYQPSRPFKPWLYAIATNLARDYFRSHANRFLTSLADDSTAEIQDTAPDPERSVEESELSSEVSRALGELSQEYRAALILRFYGGLTLQEIAETLNIPLGTVKSRLSVGTQRLRDRLIHLTEERNS